MINVFVLYVYVFPKKRYNAKSVNKYFVVSVLQDVSR